MHSVVVIILILLITNVFCHTLVKRQGNEGDLNEPDFEVEGVSGVFSGKFGGGNGSFGGFGGGNGSFGGSSGGNGSFGGSGGGGWNPRKPETREVAPNVYSFTSTGFIVSMFMVTSEGVIVIDPMKPEHAEAMLTSIRNITDAPIKYLIYSHNHYDHVEGGQVFKDKGATIISHVDAYDYLKANPKEGVLLPDNNWIGEQFNLTLGDMILEMHYLGLNHGNGMTTFVLPKEKVR